MSTEQANNREDGPLLGSWGRIGELVGIVVAVDDGTISVFNPGDRQLATAPRRDVQAVPAGAVEVTITTELPVAHGFDEGALRRWITSLVNPETRRLAHERLTDAGVDTGVAMPPTRLQVGPATTSGAICLCGARTPAPPGATVPCASCGRQAVTAPAGGAGQIEVERG